MVESFFATLTKTLLQRMRVESKEEFEQRTEQYTDRLNEDPVAFKGSYKINNIAVA